MELDVRWLGLTPTRALQRQVERRLRHGLRPFSGRLSQVTVRVVREHGRGPNSSYACALAATGPGLAPVRVLQRHPILRLAAARATDRMRHVLLREIRSGRSAARRPAFVVLAGRFATAGPLAGTRMPARPHPVTDPVPGSPS